MSAERSMSSRHMELTRVIDKATNKAANKVSNSPTQMHANHPVGSLGNLPYSGTAFASPFSTHSLESVPIDHLRCRVIRIDVLPDDVLLGIFDFHLITSMDLFYGVKREIEAWQTLIHVCRRWRYLVFGSPCRLNLQLYCTPQTPARDTLDVWPALPLLIKGSLLSTDTGNVISALGQSNRLCQIILDFGGSQLEEVLAPMHVSFPELTRLHLYSHDETLPAIPDSFMGGSAPRLQFLGLHSISFPALPKLLLSATHLVSLTLYTIPHSGYFSPQAIVAPLSVLSGLEILCLEFRSPQSRPDWGSRRPPFKRSVLPALYEFFFKGATEYFEELVTRIDTPQLSYASITFFNQIDFDCPRLAQFINCTPTLKGRDEALVQFNDSTANVTLRHRTSESDDNDLLINISCEEPDWQVSSIEQICNSLPPLSLVEDLYIGHRHSERVWKNEAIENTLWLDLLLPFITVKNLYLSKEFAPGIAAALQELVGGRITDVLPSLQNIFMEGLEPSGSFQENIAQFLAARQLLGHPIVISVWAGPISKTQKILEIG